MPPIETTELEARWLKKVLGVKSGGGVAIDTDVSLTLDALRLLVPTGRMICKFVATNGTGNTGGALSGITVPKDEIWALWFWWIVIPATLTMSFILRKTPAASGAISRNDMGFPLSSIVNPSANGAAVGNDQVVRGEFNPPEILLPGESLNPFWSYISGTAGNVDWFIAYSEVSKGQL